MSIMHRRTFLRGASGAALALPWLESLDARAAARLPKPPLRLGVMYVPMGVVREEFFPGEQRREESRYEGPHAHTSTRTLRPLDNIAAKVTLVTGLSRKWKDSSDQHEQCGSCFLSSVAPDEYKSNRIPQGRTLDHIVAEQIGGDTPFRTLEFNCNPHKDNKESLHFDTISWYGPEHPAGAMRDPQQMYRRLFLGAKAAPTERITDLVLADAQSLAGRLGSADRHKLGEYLESIRTIETQMDRLAAMRTELAKMNLPEPPAAHLPRGEYLRLIGDFMVASLHAGLTRVATMMVAPERWDTPYRFEEISEKPLSHHGLSHGGWSENLRKIDEFHLTYYAYLLEKMDAIREADGSTLLDNTIFTWGSGLGSGATHRYDRLPIVVAGGKNAGLKTGFHLQCKINLPLANLWLTQAQALGMKCDRFADGATPLSELMA